MNLLKPQILSNIGVNSFFNKKKMYDKTPKTGKRAQWQTQNAREKNDLYFGVASSSKSGQEEVK